MTIQLPDVQGLWPVAGLVVIALAAIIGIVLWVALRSKVAMAAAVVVGVIAAGPLLVQAIASIVGALVPLALIGVAGAIGLVVVLQRSPEVVDLVRDLKAPKGDEPPLIIDQQATPRLTAGRTKVVTRRTVDEDVLKDWGW